MVLNLSVTEPVDLKAKYRRMFPSPLRRSRRPWRRWLRLSLLLLFAVLFFDFILTIAISHPSTRVSSSARPSANSTSPKERIFIASMHWNNEVIIRTHWGAAVLNLVRHFGPENVYISMIEGGSFDDTKGALKDLDLELDKLGVERSIELHQTTHQDEVDRIPRVDEEGWIWTSRGKKELRRIPYLSEIRNQVMDKMKHLAERTQEKGRRNFDKILWLNDVIFTTEDVTTLLATREGKYAAACSLDFSKPPLYYDTFALRDISGAKAITHTWPFFLDSTSRQALMSNSLVPVKSCWNGIVVFQAEPFYHNTPLRFRGIPDSLANHHLEGSECCLIHEDNPLSLERGVWLNPNVRVSYNEEADKVVHPSSGSWPSRREKWTGIWNNRWVRWTAFPQRLAEQYIVDRRVDRWRAETQQRGQNFDHIGAHCIINEMQVLVHNGWAHV